MNKENRDIARSNLLHEDGTGYGFVNKSEMEKLREDVFRSDKEKFLLFTKMLRRNATLKKAVITHHKSNQ